MYAEFKKKSQTKILYNLIEKFSVLQKFTDWEYCTLFHCIISKNKETV